MAWLKASLRYLLKAYFGGCFGCLGALSAVVVFALVFALTLGPSVLGALKGIQLPAFPIPGGPESVPPSSVSPPGPDCHETIEAWVSKSVGGSPATTFARTDGIFPVVTNPTDCGKVSARLIGPNDEIVMERSYNVRGGVRNGYGDYNPERNLPAGSYTMEFWYGETLLETIPLTIQ